MSSFPPYRTRQSIKMVGIIALVMVGAHLAVWFIQSMAALHVWAAHLPKEY